MNSSVWDDIDAAWEALNSEPDCHHQQRDGRGCSADSECKRSSKCGCDGAPRNNDGRQFCFWRGAATKKFTGLSESGDVCSNNQCGK